MSEENTLRYNSDKGNIVVPTGKTAPERNENKLRSMYREISQNLAKANGILQERSFPDSNSGENFVLTDFQKTIAQVTQNLETARGALQISPGSSNGSPSSTRTGSPDSTNDEHGAVHLQVYTPEVKHPTEYDEILVHSEMDFHVAQSNHLTDLDDIKNSIEDRLNIRTTEEHNSIYENLQYKERLVFVEELQDIFRTLKHGVEQPEVLKKISNVETLLSKHLVEKLSQFDISISSKLTELKAFVGARLETSAADTKRAFERSRNILLQAIPEVREREKEGRQSSDSGRLESIHSMLLAYTEEHRHSPGVFDANLGDLKEMVLSEQKHHLDSLNHSRKRHLELKNFLKRNRASLDQSITSQLDELKTKFSKDFSRYRSETLGLLMRKLDAKAFDTEPVMMRFDDIQALIESKDEYKGESVVNSARLLKQLEALQMSVESKEVSKVGSLNFDTKTLVNTISKRFSEEISKLNTTSSEANASARLLKKLEALQTLVERKDALNLDPINLDSTALANTICTQVLEHISKLNAPQFEWNPKDLLTSNKQIESTLAEVKLFLLNDTGSTSKCHQFADAIINRLKPCIEEKIKVEASAYTNGLKGFINGILGSATASLNENISGIKSQLSRDLESKLSTTHGEVRQLLEERYQLRQQDDNTISSDFAGPLVEAKLLELDKQIIANRHHLGSEMKESTSDIKQMIAKLNINNMANMENVRSQTQVAEGAAHDLVANVMETIENMMGMTIAKYDSISERCEGIEHFQHSMNDRMVRLNEQLQAKMESGRRKLNAEVNAALKSEIHTAVKEGCDALLDKLSNNIAAQLKAQTSFYKVMLVKSQTESLESTGNIIREQHTRYLEAHEKIMGALKIIDEHSSSKGREASIKSLFDLMNKTHDGLLTPTEFLEALRESKNVAKQFDLAQHVYEGVTRDKFEAVFQSMDKDGHQEIEWENFLSYFKTREGATSGGKSSTAVEDNVSGRLEDEDAPKGISRYPSVLFSTIAVLCAVCFAYLQFTTNVRLN